MSKQLSTEAIADLYLNWLYKVEKRPLTRRNELFNINTLDRCLDEKKVYYNQLILNEAIHLLIQKGLIANNENSGGSILFYEPRDNMFDIDEWNIKAQVHEYKLTNSGKDFVLHKQKLDSEAIKAKKEKMEKWKDRLWGFLAAVFLSVLGLLLRELLSQP